MKILLEAHHPAHVHFWKYPIRELQARGHEVLLIGRDRDVMRRLLEVYDWIKTELPKRKTKKNRLPIVEMLERQWAVARAIRRFNPEVVASLMGSYTQSAKIFGVRNIIFTDSEFQRFNHRIAHPFADEIHTPECLDIDFGEKHRRYRGFHELAYLQGDTFRTEEAQLPDGFAGESVDYVVMRLSAWDTFHDINNHGFSRGELEQAIAALETKYKVYLQPEGGRLPEEFEHLRLVIPPERYHAVLARAQLVVTEGFTTASEAVILGVPSIVVNQLDGDTLRYQSRHYGILQHFGNGSNALNAIKEFLANPPDTQANREVGLKYQRDHIDMKDYVVEQILHDRH